MAQSKTARKNRLAGGKSNDAPIEKDDGTRWIVVDSNEQSVYISNGGVRKSEANRLAESLVQQATIMQV